MKPKSMKNSVTHPHVRVLPLSVPQPLKVQNHKATISLLMSFRMTHHHASIELCQFDLTTSDPADYGEALEKEEGRKATMEETQGIKKNNIQEMTDLLERKNVFSLKWVFKKKFAEDGRCKNIKLVSLL